MVNKGGLLQIGGYDTLHNESGNGGYQITTGLAS